MMSSSILDITVTAKSSRSMITCTDPGSIRVYCNAPPVDGKANDEIIILFSRQLKISKSCIEIISGKKSKKKRIAIQGLTTGEIIDRLKKS